MIHNERESTNARYRIGDEIGVDPKVILQTSHGRRSIDMLKILAPEKANWECK
jgi:glycerol 3-phosphatase-1